MGERIYKSLHKTRISSASDAQPGVDHAWRQESMAFFAPRRCCLRAWRQRKAWSADDDGFACKRRIASMSFATRHPRAIECDTLPESSKKTIKRKVAMWVGYVGTHYRGLQIQRTTAAGQTIEQELETALFKAGGILESNLGSLEKIKWMRSSRTDKGVHSLSTVISFKMEFEQKTAASDQDGLKYAERVNQYLPNTIRVFGIVPVNKSFDPRRECCSRTYYYLLPATAIDITPNCSDEEIRQKITRFQDILSLFEGRFPYHNYTMRSQYRSKTGLSKCSKEAKGPMEDTSEDSSNDESNCQDIDVEQESEVLSNTSSRENTVRIDSLVSRPPKLRWLYEVDWADKISSAHFRNVYSFKCGDLQMHEGLQFLRLIIHGESFMLHQIRKMIGTAIAVMREVLPADLIPMSLARSCRAIVPLAPSQGLFLAGNEFSPFRTSPLPRGAKNFEDPPRLKMSEPILQRKEEFWEHVLLPHMVTLLRDDDDVWKQWVEMLEWARIPEDELRGVRSAYSDYLAFRANQRNDIENGDAAIASRF